MSLKSELKNTDQGLVLLPTGLYLMNNVKVKDSGKLAEELLIDFSIGATLSIQSHPGIIASYSVKNFSVVEGEGCSPWSTQTDLDLTIELIKEELKGYHFDLSHPPYENYLEAIMMQLYIDGMALGKKLSGGVWLSSTYGGKSADVSQLELLIQLKNDAIYAVSDQLKTYPREFTHSFSRFELPPYRAGHSARVAYLEYRILQIKHKNLLQQIAVQSRYLNAEEKAEIEQEIVRIEAMKKTYPVSIGE